MSTDYYEFYRHSSIGMALVDTCDDLVQEGRITNQLAIRIVQNFDRAIAEVLASDVRSRLDFKSRGRRNWYRKCDDVHTFVLEDVDFTYDKKEHFTAGKLKIVACPPRAMG